MLLKIDCKDMADHLGSYVDGTLEAAECSALESHLRDCKACRTVLKRFRSVEGLLDNALAPNLAQRHAGEVEETSRKLAAVSSEVLAGSAEMREQPQTAADFLEQRLGSAPWWGVSLLLHGLIIALAGLVTMAVELPRAEDSVVMVTELQPRNEIVTEEPEKKPDGARSALESRHETPPTDASSQEASDIVVPPEILAKAEVGDHFETINLDRPDTQSAFGNPDAHMFHSVRGNDEPEGGGGIGGAALDDLIGVGGSASPGSGGGWGGGHGTGIGVGTGAGRGSFGNRNGGGRRLMVKRHGGSTATENAVDKALQWLAYHQELDGHWDIKKYEGGNVEGGGRCFDEGVSALATLAFLGAGHTTKVGAYKDNVRRAVAWLISKQQADGRFSPKRPEDYDQYDLALSTLALAEADGMLVGRDPKIREAAQKGIDAIVACQQPHGGWNHGGGGEGSTSVFGWMVMALKSGKIAGLKVPHTAFENAIKRMEAVSEKGAGGYWGVVGYTSRGFHPFGTLTMTAVGMVSLQFMGLGAETALQQDMIAKVPPKWRAGPTAAWSQTIPEPQNFYHWYYGTLGLFQAGGENWKTWNEGLKSALISTQQKAGDAAGSWNPETTWDTTGGRVYTTAMGALCLEVYYRYSKLSER